MTKQQIQSDAIAALKQGNAEVAGVLRMTVASINAKEKEKRYQMSKDQPGMAEAELEQGSALNDEELVSAITSEIKKRKDAIALYEQGSRPELAAKEQAEIDVLKKYLPAQLSVEEVKKLVEAAIATTGASTMKDMGKVMTELSPKIKGKADSGEVSKMVKELLNAA